MIEKMSWINKIFRKEKKEGIKKEESIIPLPILLNVRKMPLRYKNFVYLPILKNASSTYNDFFIESGWQEIYLDEVISNKKLKIFSHIQNPNVRHTKGVCQWMIGNGCIDYLDDANLSILVCTSLLDGHSNPISNTYTALLNRIHWIPLDLKSMSGNELTNKFFEDNDIPLHIDPFLIKNSHNEEFKKIYYNKINEVKENLNEANKINLKMFLYSDNKIWEKTIKYYEKKYKIRS